MINLNKTIKLKKEGKQEKLNKWDLPKNPDEQRITKLKERRIRAVRNVIRIREKNKGKECNIWQQKGALTSDKQIREKGIRAERNLIFDHPPEKK